MTDNNVIENKEISIAENDDKSDRTLWISYVDDKGNKFFPDSLRAVLVCVTKDGETERFLGHYVAGRGVWVINHEDNANVTHWMELPSSPVEEHTSFTRILRAAARDERETNDRIHALWRPMNTTLDDLTVKLIHWDEDYGLREDAWADVRTWTFNRLFFIESLLARLAARIDDADDDDDDDDYDDDGDDDDDNGGDNSSAMPKAEVPFDEDRALFNMFHERSDARDGLLYS